MKIRSIMALTGLCVGAGVSTAGDFPSDDLLVDGSLETTVPGLLNPEGWIFTPAQFNVFGINFPNLFSDGDGTTDVTPFDGSIAFELNRFVPDEWSGTFLLEDLPSFFPFDMLPGDPVDPGDPDGMRTVEVTDDNGTRMVTYNAVPAGNPKLAVARVPTTLFTGTEFDTSAPENGFNDVPMDMRPAPGDEVELTFYHYISDGTDPEDGQPFEPQPNGALSQGILEFATALGEPVISTAPVSVDLTNDPRDQWVEYTVSAVIPDGTTFINVVGIYFTLATDFRPLDQDADGMQDDVSIDGNFDGMIQESETGIPGFQFVDPDEPSIDTDGDGVNDAFTPFIELPTFGADTVTPPGSGFFDDFSLVNLGPAGPMPCAPADLAEPFGLLDGADVNAFITAFGGGEAAADLNDDGVVDGADVNSFITQFGAGCP